MPRFAELSRVTAETDIKAAINLDGSGNAKISTGIGFFDHMLNLLSKHGLVDLMVEARGDLNVDFHHTVEDVGIVLGTIIKNALGEKLSIRRYGNAFIPMDEALAMVTVDIGGRPYLVFDAGIPSQKVGDFDTELTEEFFRAVAFNSGINLHIKVLYGTNSHHIIEAIFKAFARALDQASQIDERVAGVPSTKGII